MDTLTEKGLVEKGEKHRRTNVSTVIKRDQRELEARRDRERQYVKLQLVPSDITTTAFVT